MKKKKDSGEKMKHRKILAERIHTTINVLQRYLGRPVSFEEIRRGLNKMKSMTKDYSNEEILKAMDEAHPKMWFSDILWKPKGYYNRIKKEE